MKLTSDTFGYWVVMYNDNGKPFVPESSPEPMAARKFYPELWAHDYPVSRVIFIGFLTGTAMLANDLFSVMAAEDLCATDNPRGWHRGKFEFARRSAAGSILIDRCLHEWKESGYDIEDI